MRPLLTGPHLVRIRVGKRRSFGMMNWGKHKRACVLSFVSTLYSRRAWCQAINILNRPDQLEIFHFVFGRNKLPKAAAAPTGFPFVGGPSSTKPASLRDTLCGGSYACTVTRSFWWVKFSVRSFWWVEFSTSIILVSWIFAGVRSTVTCHQNDRPPKWSISCFYLPPKWSEQNDRLKRAEMIARENV